MAEIRVREVPEDLRRGLKVRAASEGKTLNDMILEILAAALENAKRRGSPS